MEHILEIILASLLGMANSPKRFFALSGAAVLLFFSAFGLILLPYYKDTPVLLTPDFWLIILMGGVGLTLLLWGMGSYANDMPESVRRPKTIADAPGAIERLRALTVLHPERRSIAGPNWSGVDLHGLDVSEVNLRMAWLQAANLSAADLYHACLRSARLEKANLSNADLRRADLQYARLNGADLREARLDKADLRAADLSGVLLRDASLTGAKFDEFTTLPDGRKWTPGTDLTRYGVVPKSYRKPKSKIKLKRGPDDRYNAGTDGDEWFDEPEPPAWVAREGRTLRVVAKRYPPA